MSYEFKLDIGNEVVEVEYTGSVTFDERMQAINEGIAILQDREYPRILVNFLAAKMQISNAERTLLANYISEQYALLQVKTAFLIRCDPLAKEDIDEAVLRTEEFVSQVFFNRSEAIDWLSSETSDAR
jgi:hypothetical protein